MLPSQIRRLPPSETNLAYEQVENELSLLGSLPRQPRETTERINYLLNKLQTSHSKIAGFERDMTALKKVLAQEA